MGGGGYLPSMKIIHSFKCSENVQNALKHEKIKDIKMTPPLTAYMDADPMFKP